MTRMALSTLFLALSLFFGTWLCVAQQNPEPLPSAPSPQGSSLTNAHLPKNMLVTTSAVLAASFPAQAGGGASPTPQAQGPTAAGVTRLTRVQAEQIAIKNNPRISVGHLLALAQHQVYRESRSAELPAFTGDITVAEGNEGSRIGAGALNAPRLLDHAGAGVTLTQLITDFGRTNHLVSYSKLLEKAQNANALATTEDIVLATDTAFYDALQAQAMLKVAQQTVNARQTVENQINTLTQNKLKSTLDLSFAQVNLSQAKLLELDAENNVQSSAAALTSILGFEKPMQFELIEENKQLPAPPPDVDVLTNLAFSQRPDLQALSYNQQAAEKFRSAQHEQLLPTVSALGLVGGTPVRPDCVNGCFPNYFVSSWYGAIGLNMRIPIFNGFLYSAEASEANYRAKAAAESARDLRDQIARDVRTAWLAANTAFQRVGVAEELSKEADLSLRLAQSRYQLGLGSIVELSQGQLQQAQAAIGYVGAEYEYKLALSTLNFEIGARP